MPPLSRGWPGVTALHMERGGVSVTVINGEMTVVHRRGTPRTDAVRVLCLDNEDGEARRREGVMERSTCPAPLHS